MALEGPRPLAASAGCRRLLSTWPCGVDFVHLRNVYVVIPNVLDQKAMFGDKQGFGEAKDLLRILPIDYYL